MEPRKQNLDVEEPRTSKMVNIDVTDVSMFFSKNLGLFDVFQTKFKLLKKKKKNTIAILKSLIYII